MHCFCSCNRLHSDVFVLYLQLLVPFVMANKFQVSLSLKYPRSVSFEAGNLGVFLIKSVSFSDFDQT